MSASTRIMHSIEKDGVKSGQNNFKNTIYHLFFALCLFSIPLFNIINTSYFPA